MLLTAPRTPRGINQTRQPKLLLSDNRPRVNAFQHSPLQLSNSALLRLLPLQSTSGMFVHPLLHSLRTLSSRALFSPLSMLGLYTIAQELIIGVAIGFVLVNSFAHAIKMIAHLN